MRGIGWVTWRRVVAAGLALVVVAGLSFLGWTWRHPMAFDDAGGFGFGGPNHKIGDTVYFGMSFPRGHDGGSVRLDGGHATLASGAQVADTELLLCTLTAAGGGAIGSFRDDDIDTFCSSLVPIRGHRLDLRDAPLRQQVLLRVTMRKPGTIHVSDIVLDYRDGWQRGSQHVGGEVWMSTGELPQEAGFRSP